MVLSPINRFPCSNTSDVEQFQLFLDTLISDEKLVPTIFLEDFSVQVSTSYTRSSVNPIVNSIPVEYLSLADKAYLTLESIIGPKMIRKGSYL